MVVLFIFCNLTKTNIMNMGNHPKLKLFITHLNNNELCIYTHYHEMGLLPESRKLLQGELKKRGLTSYQVKKRASQPLTKKQPIPNGYCQRCGSRYLFTETDYAYKVGRAHSTKKVAYDSFRCQLCGFNPDKEPPKNLVNRIKRYFTRIKKERTAAYQHSFK